MRTYAVLCHVIGQLIDVLTVRSEWRGVRPASKAEMALLRGRWL